jgi:hypothetical protein
MAMQEKRLNFSFKWAEPSMGHPSSLRTSPVPEALSANESAPRVPMTSLC